MRSTGGKSTSLASQDSCVDSGMANTTNLILKQCLIKNLTTGVAIMPVFVSENQNTELLDSAIAFNRQKITKLQRL